MFWSLSFFGDLPILNFNKLTQREQTGKQQKNFQLRSHDGQAAKEMANIIPVQREK